MLYRHKKFEETLVHQCADADKYTTAHKREMANVRVHDISAYLSVTLYEYRVGLVRDERKVTGVTSVPIKHCPYCGVLLDGDEQTGEFLNIALEEDMKFKD